MSIGKLERFETYVETNINFFRDKFLKTSDTEQLKKLQYKKNLDGFIFIQNHIEIFIDGEMQDQREQIDLH